MSVDIVSNEGGNTMKEGSDNMTQHVMSAQQFEFEGVVGETYSECKPIQDSPLVLCVEVKSEEDVRIYLGDGVPLMEGEESLSEYLRLTHGMELQLTDNTLWDSVVIWENVNGFKKCKDLDNARVCTSYRTDENRFEMNVTLEIDDKI